MRYRCSLKHRAPRISFEALQSLLEYLISNDEDIFFSILFVHVWDPWNCFSRILMPSIWRTEGNGLLDSSVQFQVFKTHPHSQTPSHLETKWRTICKISSTQKNGYKWRPEWSSLQDYCRASEKLDVSGNESRFAGKNHIMLLSTLV